MPFIPNGYGQTPPNEPQQATSRPTEPASEPLTTPLASPTIEETGHLRKVKVGPRKLSISRWYVNPADVARDMQL